EAANQHRLGKIAEHELAVNAVAWDPHHTSEFFLCFSTSNASTLATLDGLGAAQPSDPCRFRALLRSLRLYRRRKPTRRTSASGGAASSVRQRRRRAMADEDDFTNASAFGT